MDIRIEDDKPEPARNVLGEPMDLCCEKPLTGFIPFHYEIIPSLV